MPIGKQDLAAAPGGGLKKRNEKTQNTGEIRDRNVGVGGGEQ